MDIKKETDRFMTSIRHAEFYMATFHHEADQSIDDIVASGMEVERQLLLCIRRLRTGKKAYKKLWQKCKETLSAQEQVAMEQMKENEILRDGLGEIAECVTPKGEDKLEWAIQTASDTLEVVNA